jgi:hypothetical protein
MPKGVYQRKPCVGPLALLRYQVRFTRYIAFAENGCWLWTGHKTRKGYGYAFSQGVNYRAHRLAYEWVVGLIPADLELDHLCRTTSCVNPDHLEAVPRRVNILRSDCFSAVNARKTHCKRGHEFTLENTILRTDGRNAGTRGCRQCKKANKKANRKPRRTTDAARAEHAAEMRRWRADRKLKPK